MLFIYLLFIHWCVLLFLIFIYLFYFFAACEAAGSENSDDTATGGAEVGATGHSDEDDKTTHE